MRTALLIGLLALSSCNWRLPDTVPMEVTVLVGRPRKLSSADDAAFTGFLEGAQLMAGPRVLTTLTVTPHLLEGHFDFTRVEALDARKMGYALRLKGACGPYDLPLGKPIGSTNEPSERELARTVRENKRELPMRFAIASLEPMVSVFLDAGETPTGKVTIGSMEVVPSRFGQWAGRLIPLSGCTLPVEVRREGEVIGKLSGMASAVFISTESDRCHVLHSVPGQTLPAFPEQRTKGRGVWDLLETPRWFLEPAPEGLVETEVGPLLVRRPCE